MESAHLIATRIDDQVLGLACLAASKWLASCRSGYFANANENANENEAGSRDYSEFKVEIDVLLQFLFYSITFASSKATPGMRALGLVYATLANSSGSGGKNQILVVPHGNSAADDVADGLNHGGGHKKDLLDLVASNRRRSQLLFLYFSVMYLFKKLKSNSILYNWKGYDKGDLRKHFASLIGYLEVTSNVANLANFISFLLNGKYPSILHRFLHLQLTTKRNNQASEDIIPSKSVHNVDTRHSHLTNSQLSYSSKIVIFAAIMSVVSSLAVIQGWPELVYLKNESTALLRNFLRNSSKSLNRIISKVPLCGNLINKASSFFNRGNISPSELRRKMLNFNPNMSIYTDVLHNNNNSHNNHNNNNNNIDAVDASSKDFDMPRIRPSLPTEPSVCTACSGCPAERGHALPCGHIFCFLCLQYTAANATITTSSSSSSSSAASHSNNHMTNNSSSNDKLGICTYCSVYHARLIAFRKVQSLSYLINNINNS